MSSSHPFPYTCSQYHSRHMHALCTYFFVKVEDVMSAIVSLITTEFLDHLVMPILDIKVELSDRTWCSFDPFIKRCKN